ncbi:MAG: PriCT-2 domain-containing protein [Bacteroidetes bacterium]|nr:PriCT-2 domain-containing protein [Bacteroidota bacterium]
MEYSTQNKISTSNVDDILNQKVSYQPNAWSSFSQEITILEVIKEIKCDIHERQISNLRNLLKSGDKESYNNHKKNLPAVTFCGTFEKERKKSNLKTYNCVLVLDVDKLNPEEFQRVKSCFFKDNFVFTFWESPSQQGVKGLVNLHFTFELNETNIDRAHKGAFLKLKKYFTDKYDIELDISGSDTTRLCFLSFDPIVKLKDSITGFEILEVDILIIPEPADITTRAIPVHLSNRDALFNPKDKNEPIDRKTMQSIIKYLEKRKYSITNSYEEWYRVALAIANTFTYDVGENYFLKLSSMDKAKFDEINCKNFLLNSYKSQAGEINFKTIIYFANKVGYQTKKQRVKGSEATLS